MQAKQPPSTRATKRKSSTDARPGQRSPDVASAAASSPKHIEELAILGEVPLDKLTDALYANLAAGLQLMQRFKERQTGSEQELWNKHATALQAMVRALHRERPADSGVGEEGSADAALDPDRVSEFGAKMATAREAAGLTQRALATRSGLSLKTICNIEMGRHSPSHGTVLRLLLVKELGLEHKDVPWRFRPKPDTGSTPNCWIAPGYESLKMFAELIEAVNGPGGKVEQTFVYLDHRSAENWNELCNQSEYVTKYRERMPLDAMAQRILEETGHVRLDVMALGSGDGKQETRLVEHLLDGAQRVQKTTDLRLYLLDVSQPLLNEGYQHAAAKVARRGVLVQAIQGNFHHWPRYTQLHYVPERSHRRRVVTMLGFTFGNLDNEVSFFEQTLIGLVPDDLLLLDVLLAVADPQRPDDVQRKDSALQSGPSPLHEKWLAGPLRRYCENLKSVELKHTLNVMTIVPGSYAINVAAEIELRDGQRRYFPSLHRYKRYNLARLAETMRYLGWELLLSSPSATAAHSSSSATLLFRKLPPSQPA
jgi:transcriptional regulator with XRE-family HTH domain